MYSVAFGWNILYLSIKSIQSNVSFKANVSLLIFCLDDLPIDISGVLKSPAIIVLLSISPFRSVNVCFIYLGAPMLGAQKFTSVISFVGLIPISLCNAHLCLLLKSLF